MKIVLTFLFLMLCTFCNAQNNSAVTWTAIDSLNKEMEKAFNQNDMAKVASFYADDAEIAGENYSVKGRANLDHYWASLKDKGRGWKLTVVEIGGTGEFIYELGKSDLSHLRADNPNPVKSITNFILIWKLQQNGSYKIFKDYLTKTEFSKN
jgi:ketosteroid isomerase-like protein